METNKLSKISNGSPVQEGTQIIDRETGEVVKISQEFRDEALQVHGQIEGAFWQLAIALARVRNERFYLAFGFETFKEYCEDTLPFGVRNAYHYALVGEKIGLKLIDSDSGTNLGSRLEKAGIKKLRLLVRSAEDQIKELVATGKLTIGEEELTAEELADKRFEDLKRILKEKNEKIKNVELLEEEKEHLELQRKILAEENEELKTYREEHRDRVEDQEAVARVLKKMEDAQARFFRAATSLDVGFEELARDEQKERFARLIYMGSTSFERLKNKHFELLVDLNDQSEVV